MFVTLIRTLRRPAAREERGQVLAIVALFLIVLLGFTALAVDYGTYLLARRQYQNIADAASLAGSVHMARPITFQDHADARLAAWESLRREMGLTFPLLGGAPPTADTGPTSPYQESGWSIWVDVPPTAAGSAYPGDSSISGDTSVFVRVERENPAFLARFFGIDGRVIRGWATAGNAPSRWAVIALCGRNGNCPASVESIKISGSTTSLRVINGDVGGNWGLRIDSNSDDRLQLPDDSQVYLVDTTCGPSRYLCYPAANVSDGLGTAKRVRTASAPIEDPNYAEPPWLTATAVPDRGNVGGPPGSPLTGGSVTDPTGLGVGCTPGSPAIGPGRYGNIRIGQGSCVILDPTLDLLPGQRPGIFYITGQLEINQDSFLIGDGVTLFLDSGMSPFDPVGGLVLNHGNGNTNGIPVDEEKYGAWTTKANATWTAADAAGFTSWVSPGVSEVGIAIFVRRSATPTTVFNMSGSSPLLFNGILYGPDDNVGISGSGTQAAVGQIIGWTVTYSGNTVIEQIYDGPDDARSFLLEPRTGQPD